MLRQLRGQALLLIQVQQSSERVGHQAPCPDLYAVFATPFSHKVNVGSVVVVTEKGLLAAVATLGDVVGYAGGYNSCNACHVWRIAASRCLSIIYTVPRTMRATRRSMQNWIDIYNS